MLYTFFVTEKTSQAGYKYLLTYQYSSVIYDLTFEFCQKFLPEKELLRMRDQMTQAARSGKQNIVEGYELESLESYIKLLGVAKGSLFELLEDYQDFLRQHNLRLWTKDETLMRELRDLRVVGIPEPHIESLKQKFITEGGFRENMFKRRLEYKKKKDWS